MARDLADGQPAVAFEEAHGLSGIAGRYQFSTEPGMDRASLQRKIWKPGEGMQKLHEAEIKSIFNMLELHNPEHVSKIVFDRSKPKHVKDVVHGMVSGFNTDDINYFMRRSYSPHSLEHPVWIAEDAKRTAAEVKIMQRTQLKPRMQWIASDPTLDKIWQQVKDRPVINSVEDTTQAVEGGPIHSPYGWMMAVGLIATVGVAAHLLHRRREQKVMEMAIEQVKDSEQANASPAASSSSQTWVQSLQDSPGQTHYRQ